MKDSREAEFSDFFVASAPALRRTAYVVVGDWQHAEDLTQQAFAKLYVAWPRVREQTRLPYARRVVVNECLTYLRRHRPEALHASLPDRVDEAGHPTDTVLDLGAALALLPSRQRAIIALRFLDDLSVAEVARLLDVAEGTVKSQTARALDTLRRHVPQLVSTLAEPPSEDPKDPR